MAEYHYRFVGREGRKITFESNILEKVYIDKPTNDVVFKREQSQSRALGVISVLAKRLKIDYPVLRWIQPVDTGGDLVTDVPINGYFRAADTGPNIIYLRPELPRDELMRATAHEVYHCYQSARGDYRRTTTEQIEAAARKYADEICSRLQRTQPNVTESVSQELTVEEARGYGNWYRSGGWKYLQAN